jgi:hypothetical protein
VNISSWLISCWEAARLAVSASILPVFSDEVAAPNFSNRRKSDRAQIPQRTPHYASSRHRSCRGSAPDSTMRLRPAPLELDTPARPSIGAARDSAKTFSDQHRRAGL